MNLSQTKKDNLVKIVSIKADLKLKCHLYNLGLSPNTVVLVKQNSRFGGLFIVKGALLGIKTNITKLITVEQICKKSI